MKMALFLNANQFSRVFQWFNPQLKRIWIQKTKLCFLNFLISKIFFLTFLFDMVLIRYIDANIFLLDYKAFQEGGLMVFSAIQTDM